MTKSVFDHVNAITTNQSITYFDELDEIDRKSFNAYVVNLALSMNPDYIEIVNEMNKNWDISSREVYLYYSQILPKKKQYNKWIKKKKSIDYDENLILKISKYFEVSKIESIEYLNIFFSSDSGKIKLKEILTGFGLPEKEIKKLL